MHFWVLASWYVGSVLCGTDTHIDHVCVLHIDIDQLQRGHHLSALCCYLYICLVLCHDELICIDIRRQLRDDLHTAVGHYFPLQLSHHLSAQFGHY